MNIKRTEKSSAFLSPRLSSLKDCLLMREIGKTSSLSFGKIWTKPIRLNWNSSSVSETPERSEAASEHHYCLNVCACIRSSCPIISFLALEFLFQVTYISEAPHSMFYEMKLI